MRTYATKTTNYICAVFFIFIFSIPVAADLLLAEPEVESSRLEAEILAKPYLLTYDQFFLKNKDSKDMEERLLSVFAEAQRAFLSSEWSDVELKWMQVTDYAFKADWSQPLRQIIQIAWLRLAQVSTDRDSVTSYLVQAAQFDLKFEPDKKMFPPPLLTQYQLIRQRIGRVRIGTENFKRWTYVLINGVPHPIRESDLSMAPGTKRFTFLSRHFVPVTLVLATDQLSKFTPPLTPILMGSCEKPALNEAIRTKISDQLWVGSYVGGCVYKSKPQSDVPMSALAPKNLYNTGPKIDFNVKTKQEAALYQKPKFWVGTALALGAFLVYKRSQEKQSTPTTEPSNKEGF